jgi:tetratricopeptide (TPR) repeat protein
MPQRRTDDVVHAVMTDHRIARGPFGPELLAARAESDPVVVGVRFLRTSGAPGEPPAGAEWELYRAVSALRVGARASAVPYLERLLADGSAVAPALEARPEPWLRLAEGQLAQRRYDAAEASLRRVLPLAPEIPLLRNALSIAAAGQGRGEEALEHLREALALDPGHLEARYNLGRMLLARGEAREAATHLERAVELRPNLPSGWLRLGEAREKLGERATAIAHYRRALAVEPAFTAAHVALGRALLASGDRDGAAAAFALGVRFAREPEVVEAARSEATTEPAADDGGAGGAP